MNLPHLSPAWVRRGWLAEIRLLLAGEVGHEVGHCCVVNGVI